MARPAGQPSFWNARGATVGSENLAAMNSSISVGGKPIHDLCLLTVGVGNRTVSGLVEAECNQSLFHVVCDFAGRIARWTLFHLNHERFCVCRISHAP